MRSKYHAKPTTVDGIRFASMKEAKRYLELKKLQGLGVIKKLKLQPKYELIATNKLADTSRTNASPAIDNGRLLIRTDKYLYCVGKK